MSHYPGRVALRILTALVLVSALGAASHISGARPFGTTAYAQSGCSLANGIQHVIYLQFDNVHLTRDNPNVPSDLEQMPHLLNFMESNGVLLSNHHTPLIAHTANDILTSLTGNYPDRVGQPVSNSFGYFDSSGTPQHASSFQYWTDPVSSIDTTYNLVNAAGQNTPAPWVPFTRAGCDVGAFGTADIELENVSSDIKTVFTNNGNPAPAAEAAANKDRAVADFEGIAIHCAAGSSLCSSANGSEPDLLPQEPGGYTGFNGLFGAKYVNPAICAMVPGRCSTSNGSTAVNDLTNTPIADSHGNAGFPGFDPTATQTLGYVAAMQEAGVPVTYAYIADAHGNHGPGDVNAYGPGEAAYVAQLKAYDTAFATFFSDLNAHGINQSNTLFVITADENDHFVGGPPSPAGCNGVTLPCTYNQIGEVDGNLTGLVNAEDNGLATAHPFSVHADSAPTFYVNGNPAPDDPVTRTLERAVGTLSAMNPLTGSMQPIMRFMADPVEERLLHMVTSDPARTPTFTLFANPDYYLYTDVPTCDPTDAGSNPCTVLEGPGGDAWNHGDVSPDINHTWLGMVGPGVRNLGVDNTTWSDHTDIRPTIMALTGLQDDYVHDGRVLLEDLNPGALPASLQTNEAALIRMGAAYKQIDATVGSLGLASLGISTAAIMSTSAHDLEYYVLEADLANITARRDALVAQMQTMLDGAEFGGQTVSLADSGYWTAQAQQLLIDTNTLDNAVH